MNFCIDLSSRITRVTGRPNVNTMFRTMLRTIGSLSKSKPPNEAVVKKSVDEEWEDHKRKYGKNYADKGEESMRKQLFLQTYHKVEQHNQQSDKTDTWKVNKFADRTPKELRSMCGARLPADIMQQASFDLEGIHLTTSR